MVDKNGIFVLTEKIYYIEMKKITLERGKLGSLFTVYETLNSDHGRKYFSVGDCGCSGGDQGREKQHARNEEKRTL